MPPFDRADSLEEKNLKYKTSKLENKKNHQPATTLIEPKNLDLNPEFKKALELMEKSRQNIFLTGRAGTGKSTLLNYFRNHTGKKVVVLAPTGVAALNVKGQTIHSFFKFKPDITLKNVQRIYSKNEAKNLYKKLDTLVIDEISMVRSDLLDCVDKFLKQNRFSDEPFGGVQMIFIGDLYQLPPVVTSSDREIFRTHYQSQYFFDARALQGLSVELIELEKVYRQKDDLFINLLNAVRNNSATEEDLRIFNTRYDPNFSPDPSSFSLHLTTTNDLADQINSLQLSKLKTKQYHYQAAVTGSFDRSSFPTDKELFLKAGSQIMMLNNDSQGRWVNGSIGKILSIEQGEEEEEEDGDYIVVELSDGNIVEVTLFTWEIYNFSFDQKNNSLVSETVGTFTQYPLRLAWAVTIHKSQGKTFDKVIIDLGRGTFVHGQLYVALSRCTSLEGIVLKQPVLKKHIFMDWKVVKFITGFQYQKSQQAFPLEGKINLLKEAVKNNQEVTITYLKASDVKSKRTIKPIYIGDQEFQDKTFLGVQAFDYKSQEERVFRVDRILEMEIVEANSP
jgi:ATP-dependent DNA helicase PIF1